MSFIILVRLFVVVFIYKILLCVGFGVFVFLGFFKVVVVMLGGVDGGSVFRLGLSVFLRFIFRWSCGILFG